jgi:hypothetical protein
MSIVKRTIDTYWHVAPGPQVVAAARFDQAFTGKYNEPEKEGAGKK